VRLPSHDESLTRWLRQCVVEGKRA